jgi:hypothetical protein
MLRPANPECARRVSRFSVSPPCPASSIGPAERRPLMGRSALAMPQHGRAASRTQIRERQSPHLSFALATHRVAVNPRPTRSDLRSKTSSRRLTSAGGEHTSRRIRTAVLRMQALQSGSPTPLRAPQQLEGTRDLFRRALVAPLSEHLPRASLTGGSSGGAWPPVGRQGTKSRCLL